LKGPHDFFFLSTARTLSYYLYLDLPIFWRTCTVTAARKKEKKKKHQGKIRKQFAYQNHIQSSAKLRQTIRECFITLAFQSEM